MSKKKSKKTVVTKKETKTVKTVATKKKIKPTVSRTASTTTSTTTTTAENTNELIFGKQNFLWMAIGVGLIALGMIMMLGGSMPSPDVWDDSIIYSPRITVVAPILILSGLIVEIYAIFKD